MAIQRDLAGVNDFIFDQLDAIQEYKDMDPLSKARLTDLYLRNMWKGATVNLQHKKLAMRSPEVASSRDITLPVTVEHETK